MRNVTIHLTRDRIQFEGCIADHGTGREADVAAGSWAAAAREAIEAAGFAAEVECGHGHDHHKNVVTILAGNLMLHCTLRGPRPYHLPLTPARNKLVERCLAVANAADDAGWEAARCAAV